MSFFALSGLFNGIAASVSGLVVYYRAPQDLRHRTYGLFCLACAVWSYAYFAWQTSDSPETALAYVRLLMAGAIFIPVTFLHHILALRHDVERNQRLLQSNYLLGSIFLLADLSPYFVHSVEPEIFFPFWPKPGPLFHVFLVWWIGLILYAFNLLLQAYWQETGVRRKQYFYLLVAYGVGYAGGATNFFLWYGIPIPPYGTICFSLFISLFAYGLLRYHLMDFSVLVEKSLSYLAILFLISLPAYFILLYTQMIFLGTMSYQYALVQLVLYVLILLGAYEIRLAMQGAIARTLLQIRKYRHNTRSHVAKNLTAVDDLQNLTSEIVHILGGEIRAHTAALYMLDKEKGFYVPMASYGHPLSNQAKQQFLPSDNLPQHLARTGKSISIMDSWLESVSLEKNSPLTDLRALGADIVVPFLHQGQLLGFCALGHQNAPSRYSVEQLNLLKTIAHVAVLVLQNAMFVQEINHLRTHLQQTDRLRSFERITRDLPQKIQDPLQSFKALVQLMPLRKSDDEFLARFRELVSDDFARIERLIKELLDFSRPLTPQFRKEDLNALVESGLLYVTFQTSSQMVNFEKELANNLPSVWLAPQLIMQALINLLQYSVDALGSAGGRILVKTQAISRSCGDPGVQVEISELGLDLKNESHSQNIAVWNSSMELGQALDSPALVVSHHIIQEHQGEFEVIRNRDQLTRFLVTLPTDSPKEDELIHA